jgi:hypothetical protein
MPVLAIDNFQKLSVGNDDRQQVRQVSGYGVDTRAGACFQAVVRRSRLCLIISVLIGWRVGDRPSGQGVFYVQEQ